jgi:hypothetical protein
MSDVVRQHARTVLAAPFLAEEARRHRAREIARSGRRVVEGRLISAARWELRDWLTGSVVARGDDGPAGLHAALAGAFHADGLYAEIPGPGLATPGLPPSLGRVIEEWISDFSTPDEEIAAFVGWPVDKVREHR